MMKGLKSFINDNIMDLPSGGKQMVAPPGTPGTPGAPVPQAAQVGVQHAAPPPASSYLDAEMVADIEKVISRRPSPYSQLRTSAEQMKNAIPDETTRLKAAFALLAAQGTAAQQVIASIDIHIRDVETEKTNFETQSTNAANAKVGSLRSEVEHLQAVQQSDQDTIIRLQEQIVQIQTRMNERAGTIAQKTNEANTAESQIKQTVSKFKAAADSVIASLNLKKTTLSSMLS